MHDSRARTYEKYSLLCKHSGVNIDCETEPRGGCKGQVTQFFLHDKSDQYK